MEADRPLEIEILRGLGAVEQNHFKMLKHRFTNKIRRPVLVFPSVDKTVFLSSLDSFKIDSKGRRPSKKSKILTIGFFALFLAIVERVLRQVIFLFSVSVYPFFPNRQSCFSLTTHLFLIKEFSSSFTN